MKKLATLLALSLGFSIQPAVADEFVQLSGQIKPPSGFELVAGGIVVEDGQYTATADESGKYEVIVDKGQDVKVTFTSRLRDASAPSDDSIDVFSNWSSSIDLESSRVLDLSIPKPNRVSLRFVDAQDQKLNLVRFSDAAFNQEHNGTFQSGTSWTGIQRLLVNKERPGWGPWTSNGYAEVLIFDTTNFEGFGYQGFEFGYELEGLGYATPYATSSHFPVNGDMDLKLCSPVRFGEDMTMPSDCLQTRSQQLEQGQVEENPEEPAVADEAVVSINDFMTPGPVQQGDSVHFSLEIRSSAVPEKVEVRLVSPQGEIQERKEISYPDSWNTAAFDVGFFSIPQGANNGAWSIELNVDFASGNSATSRANVTVVQSEEESLSILSLTLDGDDQLLAKTGEAHKFSLSATGDPEPAAAYLRVVNHPDLDFEMSMNKLPSEPGIESSFFTLEIPFLENMDAPTYEVETKVVNRIGQSESKTFTVRVSSEEHSLDVDSTDNKLLVQRAGSQLVIRALGKDAGNYSVYEDEKLVDNFALGDLKRAHVIEQRVTGEVRVVRDGSLEVPIEMTRDHLWFDNVNIGLVSPGKLSPSQESALDFTVNGYDRLKDGSWTARATDVTKFICTGIYGPNATFSDKVSARKRAKSACEFAEKMNPHLPVSYWSQTKETTAPSFVNKVLVTVKGFEAELLAALGGSGSQDGPSAPVNSQDELEREGAESDSGYEILNEKVDTKSGMTVTVTKLDLTERPGSTRLNLEYKMENNTSASEITEGSFKLFFDDGSSLNQYGFFNKLFPTDSSPRSYTFEWTGSKRPVLIEYEADFFASEPGDGKKWKVN